MVTTQGKGFEEKVVKIITDATGILITQPRTGDSAFTTNNAKKLFAPRVSLAWDPMGNGKTAIRVGYGMYYTLIDNLAFLLNSIPPYNGAVTFANRSLFSFLPITPRDSKGCCSRSRKTIALAWRSK